MAANRLPPFRCILLDPPWPEKGGGKSKRGADRHYGVLKKHDIIRVIYQSGYWSPDDNCHMWMWVTDNYLKDGLFVMEALGFRYVRMAVWPKPSIGLGQYLRGQHESCLFGVKGRLPSLVRDGSSLFGDGKLIKTGVHSKKPIESYEKIERVSPGPRLELFCRKRRKGWWAWGNQLAQSSR
jgi:N6-adenosine-specific RNA methylase IME4